MKNAKKLGFALLGMALMIIGGILMFDFLLQFLRFVIGIILFIIGLQFVFTSPRMTYRKVK